MVISFLQMSTSLAFCQKGYCKVVGRYFVPKEVKSKQCTFENDFFEDYSIEFYPNCKFKYYSNNPLFGPSQTYGVWSLSESGDTITLDSGRKELSMESMGYFKYPFRRYTFKTLELSKGCVNWYEDGDSYSTCYCFLTICGDTIKLRQMRTELFLSAKTPPLHVFGQRLILALQTKCVCLQIENLIFSFLSIL